MLTAYLIVGTIVGITLVVAVFSNPPGPRTLGANIALAAMAVTAFVFTVCTWPAVLGFYLGGRLK